MRAEINISMFLVFFSLYIITANSDFKQSFKSVNPKKELLVKALNIPRKNTVVTRLPHHINTTQNEYLPVISRDGKTLYFTGMDRTGFFDFKIDFTKSKNAGGEDIFTSVLRNGVWYDAKPIKYLNTNSHENVTDILKDGSLLITGNYMENLGPAESTEGAQTTDLFEARKQKDGFQILHFPEPVNSIFNEFDAITDDNQTFIIFSSDRPGHVGKYHKKGWAWNGNKWGNTDIYVSTKQNDEWSAPINLGSTINTEAAERTPWLSSDGLTLYISSNGHLPNRNDMEIMCFKRKSKSDWKNWTGPFPLQDINSPSDDWGFKIDNNGNGYFARAIPLGFEPTQKARGGDAGFKETNFRSGYTVTGAQAAALNRNENNEIFSYSSKDKPTITLPNLIFEFDSYKIKQALTIELDKVVDYCKQNPDKDIRVEGHTDNVGKENYNMSLSEKRAQEISNYLKQKNIKNNIFSVAKGSTKPLNLNKNENEREANRRVEFYFIEKNK